MQVDECPGSEVLVLVNPGVFPYPGHVFPYRILIDWIYTCVGCSFFFFVFLIVGIGRVFIDNADEIDKYKSRHFYTCSTDEWNTFLLKPHQCGLKHWVNCRDDCQCILSSHSACIIGKSKESFYNYVVVIKLITQRMYDALQVVKKWGV